MFSVKQVVSLSGHSAAAEIRVSDTYIALFYSEHSKGVKVSSLIQFGISVLSSEKQA